MRIVIAAGLLFAVSACGSSSGSASPSSCDSEVPSGATAVATEGTDQLRFEPAELTAAAGPVHVTLDNPSSLPHTLVFNDLDFKLSTDAGEECGGSLAFESGSYAFHCDVPGHEEAGMKGVLVVE